MTALPSQPEIAIATAPLEAPELLLARVFRSGRVLIGGGLIAAVLIACLATLPFTLKKGHALYFDQQAAFAPRSQPAIRPAPLAFGSDDIGRSLLGRCLLGGSISLLIGVSAAAISVVLGVSVGLIAGYRGGWVDAILMRSVDVFYGLPYILLVILFKIAFQDQIRWLMENTLTRWSNGKLDASRMANLIVLFLAIGLVSWLTMARVVRGQVLSLRSQPFIEAARASGLSERSIFLRHLLPNLSGPIIVYATLTIPQAILQESFLSFLGVGIAAPMPTWGSLASEGLLPALNTVNSDWWRLLFPCTLLALTLLSLNFVGDGLRDVFDPRRDAAKI